MGKTCLSVVFDNGHVGKFLDWRDANIHAPNDAHNKTPTITTTHVSHENDNIAQLTDLLEHMAFTAATIISSKHDDPSHMQQLLESLNDPFVFMQIPWPSHIDSFGPPTVPTTATFPMLPDLPSTKGE
jgi:hypothetical protein